MITASAPPPCAGTVAGLLAGGPWLAGLTPVQLAQLPALAAHLPLHGALAGAGLACAHTQRACDILATTYEASDAHCGFVAVAPPCAPTATRAELLDAARRTWRGWRDTASTWKQSVTACSTQPCDNSVRRPLPNCWLCQAGRVQ